MPRRDLPPEADAAPIDKMGIMRAMLAVNVAVILGYLVHDWLSSQSAIKLPLFVPCLIMGIVLSNTVPVRLPAAALARANRLARADLQLCAVDLSRHVA